jgi:hypothetical protein
MAGKLYFSYGSHFAGTQEINQCQPGSRLIRAYAEGRNAKAAGALQATNPHPSGTPANGAWDFGWSNKNTGTPPGHCCV